MGPHLHKFLFTVGIIASRREKTLIIITSFTLFSESVNSFVSASRSPSTCERTYHILTRFYGWKKKRRRENRNQLNDIVILLLLGREYCIGSEETHFFNKETASHRVPPL